MTRPTLHVAIAGTKNTASDYNDNFDMMLNYLDESIEAAENYVDSFMPSQTGNAGKFLQTNGTSASWVNVGGNFPYSGYIDGLIISKASDDTISVGIGSCYDTSRTVILSLDTPTSKQNDSQAQNTTYYVYIISLDNECGVAISTSNSTPPPATYDYYRLLGSYRTDDNGKISSISNFSNSSVLVPDLSNAISYNVDTTEKEMPDNGFLIVDTASTEASGNTNFTLKINDVTIAWGKWVAGSYVIALTGTFPVVKGDTVKFSHNGVSGSGYAGWLNICMFVPFKGV